MSNAFYYGKGTRAEARELALTQVDDLNSAQYIVFPGTNDELIPLCVFNLRHTDQGLTAASDYLFHKTFAHKLTKLGLHVKATASGVDELEKAGMLHVNFTGRKPVFSDELDFMGWNGLELLNGVLMPDLLVDQRTEEEERQGKQPSNVLAVYKHSYIDALIKGRTLVVFIGHYKRNGNGNKYVAKFVEQWLNPDKAEALQDRSDAIRSRTEQINLVNPIKREAAAKAKASNGDGVAAPVVDPDTGEVEPTPEVTMMISVVGRKTKRDLFKIPAGEYAIAQAGRLIGADVIPWDPNDASSIFVWEGIVEGEFEISLD